MGVLVKLIREIRLRLNSGRYTPVKIIVKDSIGYYDGYYECKTEEYEIRSRWYENLNKMPLEDAIKIMDKEYAELERKYFGPMYVEDK